MGVPKFFRWISERYPMCSELITEKRIPEFDNLYLDMNGIIHNCSHPNDDDVHFRLTEEQMFLSIFDYIDHLFNKIKPRKVFFMAIDGVAPRAKMNQQRARRFRSAQEAHQRLLKALQMGEDVDSTQEAFDSNCITPGTPFMKKLSLHLKYFVRKKMNEDANWRNVKVILSGHEVPGEGEHKIMEYIRSNKAQSNYDPNTRHCLYGLDADLIMLGLVTHEPLFSLLREEVTFGPKKRKKSGPATLENQNFYLMHLSLFREYLGKEFQDLKGRMKVEFDLEHVIDDFVLLSLFVGNDFLPHLPNLHINEGALSLMFRLYKHVMVEANDYMNKDGRINLASLAAMLKELEVVEKKTFQAFAEIDENGEPLSSGSDSDQIIVSKPKKRGGRSKGRGSRRHKEKGAKNGITIEEKLICTRLEEFLASKQQVCALTTENAEFLDDICFKLKLFLDVTGEGEWLVARQDGEDVSDDEVDDGRFRILSQFSKRPIVQPQPEIQALDYAQEHANWKRSYYLNKLEIDIEKRPEDLSALVHEYIRGLQWVLLYYYDGVASWGWFYPYHYSPHITDVGHINLREVDLGFEMGAPFRPFEQLMGVLPAASRKHLPECLQELMISTLSPIIDFYPADFEIDLNGKKNDWEAVIKIPFIDEARLLEAIETKEAGLSLEEQQRNSIGQPLLFKYSKDAYEYPSSLPGVFPDLVQCHCSDSVYELPKWETLRRGLCEGLALAAGFPTFRHIPHSSTIGVHGVNIFQCDSKNDSVVLHIEKKQPTCEEIGKVWLGRSVYVDWPYLREAKVEIVSDGKLAMRLSNDALTELELSEMGEFRGAANDVLRRYSKRYAVELDPVQFMVAVRTISRMIRTLDGRVQREYSEALTWVPWQIVVEEAGYVDQRFIERGPVALRKEFPPGTRIFYLGTEFFGTPGQVNEFNAKKKKLDCNVIVGSASVLPLGKQILQRFSEALRFIPSYAVAKRLGISSLALSKLSSSLHVVMTTLGTGNSDQKWNLGLQMKYDAKGFKIVGYTQKTIQGWSYSQAAVELLQRFKTAFPEFVARLERKPANATSKAWYSDTDFYPAEVAKEKLQGIKQWIKDSPVNDFERVHVDAHSMTKDQVLQLEQLIVGNAASVPVEMKRLTSVSPDMVLKPEYADLVLGNQAFDLGDRVISVSDRGKVPLAALGYIVGLDGDHSEVVFDATFMGGSKLNGRCTEPRGLVVKKAFLLNLSNPQSPAAWARMRQRSAVKKTFHKVRVIPPSNAWQGEAPPAQVMAAPTPRREKPNSRRRQDVKPGQHPAPATTDVSADALTAMFKQQLNILPQHSSRPGTAEDMTNSLKQLLDLPSASSSLPQGIPAKDMPAAHSSGDSPTDAIKKLLDIGKPNGGHQSQSDQSVQRGRGRGRARASERGGGAHRGRGRGGCRVGHHHPGSHPHYPVEVEVYVPGQSAQSMQQQVPPANVSGSSEWPEPPPPPPADEVARAAAAHFERVANVQPWIQSQMQGSGVAASTIETFHQQSVRFIPKKTRKVHRVQADHQHPPS